MDAAQRKQQQGLLAVKRGGEAIMLEPGFYCMDCMDGMKHFPDKYFDLAIVDPPYGIGIGHKHKFKKSISLVGGARPFGGKSIQQGKHKSYDSKFYHPFDDSASPDGEYFDELFRVSKAQIIWGGNFFLDYLGKASCIIVWDKARRGMDQADCEIAWTSLKGQSRVFNFRWNGMLQQDMKHKEKRIHPTQKPVALYSWLVERFTKHGDIILDTHVGSASSLIAFERAGLEYVGFEKDKYYYDIAKKRLEDERNM
jgi:site-specific DNA-methyltransferase (adenine-specific)